MVAGGQVGITHGEFNVAMAQEFLYCLEPHPPHHQVGSKGMPEIMEPEINDSGLAAGGFEGGPDIIEPVPILVAENIGRFELMPAPVYGHRKRYQLREFWP